MANLTEKELSVLQDNMAAEQLLVKKFRTYASMCNDAQIKTQCEQLASQHQTHFDRLMSYLG